MKNKQSVVANTFCALFVALAFLSFFTIAYGDTAELNQTLPAVSPDTADASKGGPQVAWSVVHVICTKALSDGTGFVHKSGWIVTAAHVVHSCGNAILVRTARGQNLPVTAVRKNDLLDLAILSTEPHPDVARTLALSANSIFAMGSRVSTWGFPSGYSGDMPLLSVGYLAGVQQVRNRFGLPPPSWVVNGAFNLGNSGGPVISIQDGSVIGVVNSKLAPIPQDLENSLKALASNRNGFMYKRQRPDGTVENLTEGQVIAEILYYLRKQVQLVVGYAVQVKELRQFLKDNGIEP